MLRILYIVKNVELKLLKKVIEMYCENCDIHFEGGDYCPECGHKSYEVLNKYKTISVLGLVGIFIFFPITLVIGAYLYTRPEPFAKRRGKYMVLLPIIILVILPIIIGIL